MSRLFLLAIAALAFSGCSGRPPNRPDTSAPRVDSVAARPHGVTFTRGPGGSIQTTLGYGIKVNSASSLQREWITAHDSLLPVDLSGTIGVVTAYKTGSSYSYGDYEYRANVPVRTRDSLSAVEIRFVLFDIWGDFVKTLSMTEVEDVPANTTKTYSPAWRLYSENEASEHYASIAYVARVRTKAGRVFEANYTPIVAEARKLSERFTPEDLDPRRRPARDSSTAAK